MPTKQPPRYGQVVVGPPGSGKTTYCDGMQQYLKLLGRDACVINLDPANEAGAGTKIKKDGVDAGKKDEGNNKLLPYDVIYDVCEEAVNLSSVMEKMGLGPNGGLVYCMEYLEAHADAIIVAIQSRIADQKRPYLLFDLPGQVELYTHSTCVQALLQKLIKEMDLRLTAVQLIDAHYCTDATKFISAALLGTTTMLRLELPAVNVLSKVDLLETYGELPLQFDFFTDCQELDRLLPFLSDPERRAQEDIDEDFDFADDPEYQKVRRKRRQSKLYQKFEKLHKALAEVVDDFGLLSFLPLDITSAESVGRVLAKIDKCNGYVFVEASINGDLFQCAIQSADTDFEALADVRERVAAPESIKELSQR